MLISSVDDSPKENENKFVTYSVKNKLLPNLLKKTWKTKMYNRETSCFLNRCQSSVRNAVLAIEVVNEALGHNSNDLVINLFSIHERHTKLRTKIAIRVKTQFC